MERETPATTSPAENTTPEATKWVLRPSQLRVKTKKYYIPSMPGKDYETVNTQVVCKETLYPYAQIMFCQDLIKELSDAVADIMAQLSLTKGMKRWKGKGKQELNMR